MEILLDTSVLGRLANRADASHTIATTAIAKLHRRGERLRITAQNLIEFRNFATRPTTANGLGLSTVDASALGSTFEASFPLLVETPAIYPTWLTLVDALGVVGKQVHDARLVAVCHVHAVTHLLTFNIGHFSRLAAFGSGLVILDPAKI